MISFHFRERVGVRVRSSSDIEPAILNRVKDDVKCEEGSLESRAREPSCYGNIPCRPRAPEGDARGKCGSSEREPLSDQGKSIPEQ